MLKPVGNEDIYMETEKANSNIWKWFKKNWKSVVFYAIVLFQLLSLIFGWSGYSAVIALKTGDADVKLEFNDMEYDSSNQMEDVDIFSYVPKVPRYFCIHHTGSKGDQSEAELWAIFRQRFSNGKPGYNFSLRRDGSVITFSPIDWSPYLEYKETVNGVRLKNSITISVSVMGGRDENDITPEQLNTLRYMWISFKQRFPNIELTTHRELASKDYNKNGRIDPHERSTECPGFNKDTYFF